MSSDRLPLAVPAPAALSGRLHRRRRRGGREPLALQAIPLVATMFFLLIVHVVVTAFGGAGAAASEGAAPPDATGAVTVAALRSGAVFVGAQPVAIDGLAAAVRAALYARGADRVLVRADGALPTGSLLAVMDACRAGGAAHVAVAAVRGAMAEAP